MKTVKERQNGQQTFSCELSVKQVCKPLNQKFGGIIQVMYNLIFGSILNIDYNALNTNIILFNTELI
jgi:hypothetical protein